MNQNIILNFARVIFQKYPKVDEKESWPHLIPRVPTWEHVILVQIAKNRQN